MGKNPRVKQWLQYMAQAARSANRRRLERRHAHKGLTYADWIRLHDTLDDARLRALQARLAALPRQPLISVLMPVYNPAPDWLRQAIGSVEQQIYPQWELCIADDCSTDPAVHAVLDEASRRDARIRVLRREKNGHIAHASNTALEMARGEFVALLDHDDVVPPHALMLNAEAIVHHPGVRLLYSDEDMLRFDGERQSPNFKPDWNPALMHAQNLVCHLGVYATELVRQIGGFRPGLEGAQDYDLALRCLEHLQDDQILHIPHVLYHWRQHAGSSAAGDDVKPYIVEAGRRALEEHLQRTGTAATVTPSAGGGYRVVPTLGTPLPTLSLLVRSTEDAAKVQQRHAHLLAGRTAPLVAGARLPQPDADGLAIECLVCAVGAETQAAERARGDFLCLLADDVDILDAQALEEMVALASIPGTGPVGAKLLRADGRLAHGGYVLGAGECVAAAHPGLPVGAHGYRSRAVLNQNLAAVSSACLVIRRARFLEVGGFDDSLASGLRDVDLCLRLRDRGLRTVWAAHAIAVQRDESTPPPWPEGELDRLRRRWGASLADDPAYNPNLDLEAADFRLAPQPRVELQKAWFRRDAAPTGAAPSQTPAPKVVRAAP